MKNLRSKLIVTALITSLAVLSINASFAGTSQAWPRKLPGLVSFGNLG